MHVKVFDLAAAYLESKHSLTTVGAFMSPSHDDYVSGKFHGKEFIRARDRVHMCTLATDDHPFLRVSSWESEQKSFIDFPDVARAINESLMKQFNGHVRLVYVCGTDHVRKCGLSIGIRPNILVCAIRRPGYDAFETKNCFVYDAGFLLCICFFVHFLHIVGDFMQKPSCLLCIMYYFCVGYRS